MRVQAAIDDDVNPEGGEATAVDSDTFGQYPSSPSLYSLFVLFYG